MSSRLSCLMAVSMLGVLICLGGCPTGGTGTPTPRASIGVSDTSHDFGEEETDWSFQVWNKGDAGTTLTFTVSDDRDWIATSATGNTSVDETDKQTVTVTVDRDAFEKATATGTVMIAASGLSTVDVDISADYTPIEPIDPWERAVGGDLEEYAAEYALLPDGSVVTVGYTSSMGAGEADMYFTKVNAEGTVLWQRTFGGSRAEEAVSFVQTPDGGFLLAGYTVSYGAGGSDMYVVRTNANGTELWSRTYGGTDNDVAKDVALTDDGGFILVGHSFSLGAGDANVLLVRADDAGRLQWADLFGGAQSDYGEWVQQTPDGGFLAGGYTYSFGVLSQDIYLIKTTDYGDVILPQKTEASFCLERAKGIAESTPNQ